MKNGVEFDVAFSLDDAKAMAWAIIFGQFEGGKWNWNTFRWDKPD